MTRVGVTAVSNVLLLPIFMSGYYATSFAVITALPFIASFNVIQGAISILGGFLLYEAILLRFRNNNGAVKPGDSMAKK